MRRLLASPPMLLFHPPLTHTHTRGPSVQVAKVANVSLLALYKEKKDKPRS